MKKHFFNTLAFKKLFCISTAVMLAMCAGYVHQAGAADSKADTTDYEEDTTDKTNSWVSPEYRVNTGPLPGSISVSDKIAGITNQGKEISGTCDSNSNADYWGYNRSGFYEPDGYYVITESKSDSTKVLPNHNRYLVRLHEGSDPDIYHDKNITTSHSSYSDFGIYYKLIKTDTIYIRVSRTGGDAKTLGTPVIHLKDSSGNEYLSSDSSVCKGGQYDDIYCFTVPDATKEFTAWQEPVAGYTTNCTKEAPGKVTNTSMLEIVNTPDSGAEMEKLSIDVKKFDEDTCTRKVKIYQDGMLFKTVSVTNHTEEEVPKYDGNGYRHWYFIACDDYDKATEEKYTSQDPNKDEYSIAISPKETKTGTVSWEKEDKTCFNVRGESIGLDTDQSYSLTFTPEYISKDDGKGYVAYSPCSDAVAHTATIKQQKDIEKYAISLPVYSPDGHKIVWSVKMSYSNRLSSSDHSDRFDYKTHKPFYEQSGGGEKSNDIVMAQVNIPVLVCNSTSDDQDVTIDSSPYTIWSTPFTKYDVYSLPSGTDPNVKVKDTEVKVFSSTEKPAYFHFPDGMAGRKYAYMLSKEYPIDFSCLDQDSGISGKEYLSGVDVSIYQGDGNTDTYPGSHYPGDGNGLTLLQKFTSKNEKETISFIPGTDYYPGTYYYKVSSIPHPYIAASDASEEDVLHEFIIDTSGCLQIWDDSSHEWVKMENGKNSIALEFKLPGQAILFSKEDSSGSPVSGARLTLTGTLESSSTPFKQSWVSSANTKSLNLHFGNYTLHEDEAPSGYILADDIHFSVDEGGVHIDGKRGTSDTVTMVDQKKYKVSFSKTDVQGNPISGAKLEIKKGSDDSLAGWVSDSTPHEEELEPGSYTLHEASAPEGYGLTDDVDFTIADDGKITVDGKSVSRITMTDKKKPVLPNTGSYTALVMTAISILGAAAILLVRKHNDSEDEEKE